MGKYWKFVEPEQTESVSEDSHLAENFVLGETTNTKPTCAIKIQNVYFFIFIFIIFTSIYMFVYTEVVCQ